jgi:hypothetical protein
MLAAYRMRARLAFCCGVASLILPCPLSSTRSVGFSVQGMADRG